MTNQTLLNNHELCTLATCPISFGTVRYIPSLAGNALYLAIFAAVLAVQIILGSLYRNWAFMIAWLFGQALEVAGYVSRIKMHDNIFASNPFLMYVILKNRWMLF